MDILLIRELRGIAAKIRIDTVEQIYNAKSGHPGGALSIAEMLSVLYFYKMKVNPKEPGWDGRDRFVLSKGHASAALYSVLAQKGFFPKEELKKFRKMGGCLQGHPDMKKIPGVDMSTGSLGQGLSAANGMAIVGKKYKKNYRVYAIVGDGEIQEGQIWEAAMTAAHYKLDNLAVLLDNNNLQIDGEIENVMSPYPINKKFAAFGWGVIEIDGHDIKQLADALDCAEKTKGAPTLILCSTVKGKGVSFMENLAKWHGAPPTQEERDIAVVELKSALEQGGLIWEK